MTAPNTRKIPRQATSYMTTRNGEPPAPDDPLLGFDPVPHSRPRRNSITAERQRAFISHLAATGIVTAAARHIGASMEALYKLRQRPGAEAFCAAWDAAVDRGVQRLEDTALARAIAGEERMVVSSGQVLGTEVRHNEALVMFFLRNRRADRYGGQVQAGHPLYERVRAEVLAELAVQSELDHEEVLRGLNAKFDMMRARESALAGLEADLAAEEAGEEKY
ncbi:hypothetical protein M3P36_14565 [Altererythrobacter sp. KTW20L]|uniref:hypothetical protein n=1 Tax=Altererythrobacter sp. KTW20L TaxID=2942210 RepID=UPI0020BE8062|nr:hypothetical protein [Altererythrobacter sp. KTW20L]MCL6252262.1 hypothetical protein [Altererythrobacter sp. KTW20L]